MSVGSQISLQNRFKLFFQHRQIAGAFFAASRKHCVVFRQKSFCSQISVACRKLSNFVLFASNFKRNYLENRNTRLRPRIFVYLAPKLSFQAKSFCTPLIVMRVIYVIDAISGAYKIQRTASIIECSGFSFQFGHRRSLVINN